MQAMSTNKTAERLRKAADIIESGHPFEWEDAHGQWKPAIASDIVSLISDGFDVRLALATPPDSRPLHNPNNLTAEQVGAGFRLLTQDEFRADLQLRHYEWYSVMQERWILEPQPHTTRAPCANPLPLPSKKETPRSTRETGRQAGDAISNGAFTIMNSKPSIRQSKF